MRLFILTALVMVPGLLFAQNTCVASDGDWNDASTWSSCSSDIPQDGDVAVIPDGVSVTVSQSNQYGANSSAPSLTIYVGENDGDDATLSISGKLNLQEGSSIVVYTGSTTTDDGSGSSEKIRWWDSSGGQVASLSGSDVAFTGPVTVADGVTSSGTLPIELLSFGAEKLVDEVLVSWSTVSELDNDFFTLELSHDLIDFVVVDEVIGRGTTNEQQEYSSLYKLSPQDNESDYLYFRLTQTDFDGAFEVFEVVAVPMNGSAGGLNLSVYPNPVVDQFIVTQNHRHGGEQVSYDFELFDQSGFIVQSGTSETNNSVNVSDLPQGTFLLTISTENGGQKETLLIER